MYERTAQDGPGATSETALPGDASGNELPEDDRWDCRLRKVDLLNSETGETRGLDCKRWACAEHGPRLAWRWRQRVAMVPWQLMLTLTLVPEDRDQARAAWGKLARWLRSRGMTTYLRVMELGSLHGMRHWHVLVDMPWVTQSELSTRCAEVGLGSVVWVSKVKDRIAATYYLLGYVFKSLGVTDERQEGWRKVTVSRNVPNWTRVLRARHDWREDSSAAHWSVVVGSYRHMPDALTYESFVKGSEAWRETLEANGAIEWNGSSG